MRKVGIIFLMISMVGFLGATTRFGGRSSSLRIGAGATINLNTNMTIDEGTVRIDNGGSLTGDGGVYAEFSQGVLEYHDFETFFTGRLNIDEPTHAVKLSTNGDLVRSEPGMVIDGIQVEAGITATILGQPFMDDTILLNDGAMVYLGLQSKLNCTVSMNANAVAWAAGNAWTTVSLEDDLILEDRVILDHRGTISFNGHSIVTGGDDLTWSSSDQIWYHAADLQLGGDLTLGATIVFDGASTATSYIFGNKHTLNMNDKTLFVARDTTLKIENLIINGLHGKASGGGSSAGAIVLDEGAYIAFKNVTILMDTSNTYEFDRGTLYVIKGGFLNILPGGDTAQNFEYSTNATELSIQSNAKLIIGRGATFEYDCATATEISFADDTSEICIDTGTFKVTQNWTFETGTLMVDGKASIDTTGETTIAVDSTADLVIMPDATLRVDGNGTLQYGNEAAVAEEGDLEETSKFIDSDGAGGDNFGAAAAISGDYAIVGSPGDDSSKGSATVFFRNGGTWELQQKITASDGSSNDKFGFSVAIDGIYAIVGAYVVGSYTGAAYIFGRSGSSWSQLKKVAASDAASGDRFGYSVGISGDYAIVGACKEDEEGTDAGAAYIFDRNYGLGAGWWQRVKLTGSDSEENAEFGFSVAISGDYAIVGSPKENNPGGDDRGSAYVFERDGTTWPKKTRFEALSQTYMDYFGWSVSISGDYAVCGALYDDDGGSSSGSAYIFERSGGGVWGSDQGSYSRETQKITASDAASSDYFGCAVGISGDRLVVGAYGDGGSGVDKGSAYLFNRSGGTWTESEKMVASDGVDGDSFGKAVAISGTYAIAGAEEDDNAKGNSAGGAYLFEFS